MKDLSNDIAKQIHDAYQSKNALCIEGGNSKRFIGREIQGDTLSLRNHIGIIEYEPSELYITARSGTSLINIENEIANNNQILPFEPPHFSSAATVGGMIATGLSGPRRMSHGSVRDCILGVEIISGKGEILRFGGKVMKNVAGYDVSRLMCGAYGSLGAIVTISVRLMPKPECENTIVVLLTYLDAIKKMNDLANAPFPITANFYDGNALYIRISGSKSAVNECSKIIGGDTLENDESFWISIREQTHEFFNTEIPLWRISVPSNTPELNIDGHCAMEWNGALRWYKSEMRADALRNIVSQAGGHAHLFRGNSIDDIFHPLDKTTHKLNQSLKQVFDPANILNPGKMYADI